MTLCCGKMDQRFTPAEYVDIRLLYGFCDRNSRAAVEKHRRRFPNRQVLSDTHQRLRETGTIVRRDQGHVARRVVAVVQRSPATSVRIGESAWQVWQAMHEEGLYPYNLQSTQSLKPDDYDIHIQFC
jgi:hypothetical protein